MFKNLKKITKSVKILIALSQHLQSINDINSKKYSFLLENFSLDDEEEKISVFLKSAQMFIYMIQNFFYMS